MWPLGAWALPQAAAPTPAGAHGLFSPIVTDLGEKLQALVTGDENADIEPQETFGTRALGVILTFFNAAYEQGKTFTVHFTVEADVTAWLQQQMTDARLYDRWVSLGWSLLFVVGLAFGAGLIADILLVPVLRRVTRREGATFFARAGILFGWLCVALIPVIVFLAVALGLLDQNDPPKLARFVVMSVVYALALLRLVRLATRFFLAPNAPHLRLIPLATDQAFSVVRWVGALSFAMVFDYVVVDVARLLKVPVSAVQSFQVLMGLAVIVMAIAFILQKRAIVSSLLRRNLSAARKDLTLGQGLRLWFARSWHGLAIAYLVIGYAVTILGPDDGFALMQRGTVLTLLILVFLRLALQLLARPGSRSRAKEDAARAGLFYPTMRFLLRIVAWAFGVAGIAAAWGVDVPGLLASPWGQRVLGSVFSITSTLVLVVLVYEGLHALIERKLNRRDSDGHVIEINPRARTLLPVARNAAIVALSAIVGMVTLSELGVNIAPLLAGAGVIGVALGFGSQTLVKDFLTGLFIILEDSIAVGDVIAIGEHGGTVENITIRTVQLRDPQGNLHILPFSEITKIVNQSKVYSYALMDIGVAYSSNLDHVMDVMRVTGVALKKDPAFSPLILEPIEVLGVETFADSAIIVRCRIKTRPGKQWDVKRAYMLRLKAAFDEQKITIPFPTVMQVKEG